MAGYEKVIVRNVWHRRKLYSSITKRYHCSGYCIKLQQTIE